ncbi:DNA-binding protein RFX7-like [Ptychodera flava]|uniref:DNA-binding protein RFX7-like n=1 Tax=Ptychodera flava TaxID=63121 RepID=UPI00396A48ED
MEDNSKVQSPTRVQTKTESWKKGVESMVSQDAKKKINSILIDVEKFSELEKLFLYLKLPTGETEDYAVRDSRSGTPTMTVTRAEQTHAFNWIRSHLEESPSTSLPKHEVYEDYRAFCESSNHSVLSAADFGKIIKCVFPNIKARRLGTRGNSKYCYSGIRKKAEIKPPSLPSLDLTDQDMADSGLNCVCNCNHHPNNSQEEDQTMSAASFLVCEWAQKLLGRAFDTLLDLARYLVGSNCVSTKSMAAFTVLADMEINCRSSKSSDYGLIRRPALVQPHQEARRQLQRKIQERKILKFQKEMSEHQSNIESHSKVKSEVNNADKGKVLRCPLLPRK